MKANSLVRHRSSIATAMLLSCTCLLAPSTGCMTTPVTGRSALVLFNDGEMAQMGDQAFSQIRKDTRESRDAHSKEVIERVVKRITTSAGPETAGIQWQVELFDSTEVNAFALPGGHVGVYAGILPVCANEAALAAVLGHEIGHVVAKHSAQRMSTAAITNLGLAAAGAALENNRNANLIMAGLGVGATVGVALPFSRSNEAEADQIGQVYMARAGYDPREAPRLWVRMREQSERSGGGKPPALLSTHPPDDERIRALEANLPRALAEYQRSPQYGTGEALTPLAPTVHEHGASDGGSNRSDRGGPGSGGNEPEASQGGGPRVESTANPANRGWLTPR